MCGSTSRAKAIAAVPAKPKVAFIRDEPGTKSSGASSGVTPASATESSSRRSAATSRKPCAPSGSNGERSTVTSSPGTR